MGIFPVPGLFKNPYGHLHVTFPFFYLLHLKTEIPKICVCNGHLDFRIIQFPDDIHRQFQLLFGLVKPSRLTVEETEIIVKRRHTIVRPGYMFAENQVRLSV